MTKLKIKLIIRLWPRETVFSFMSDREPPAHRGSKYLKARRADGLLDAGIGVTPSGEKTNASQVRRERES